MTDNVNLSDLTKVAQTGAGTNDYALAYSEYVAVVKE